MKKVVLCSALLAVLIFVSGCSYGIFGSVYSNVVLPAQATHNKGASKKGESVCESVLGIAAWGDCSIEKAAKNGNITEIQSVDTQRFSILGIYNKQTTIVSRN